MYSLILIKLEFSRQILGKWPTWRTRIITWCTVNKM